MNGGDHVAQLTGHYTMPQTSLMQRSLAAFAILYGRHATLDALLQAAAQIAAQILSVDYFGIAWIEGDGKNFRVRASFGTSGAKGYADEVHNLVASIIRCNGSSAKADHSANVLAVPLRVQAKVVGYIFANGLQPDKVEAGNRESLLAALSEHIGSAIEMHNMRQMLASSYLGKTLGLGRKKGVSGQNGFNSHMLTAVAEPEKVATIIARTFYKDLRKAGFESGQILTVATELIGSLTEALHKTTVKTKSQVTKPKLQMNINLQNPNSDTNEAFENFGIGY